MKLVFAPSAAEVLRAISSYTLETWGVLQAERYILGLWARLSAIGDNPETFRLREELAPGCRSALYESHVIYFRVRLENIEVMRILHAGMDFGRHLANENPPV